MHEISSQNRNISQFSVYHHTMSDIWDDGSKYKNFTEQEWNVKKSFSFDDYRSFSDMKIFKRFTQNNLLLVPKVKKVIIYMDTTVKNDNSKVMKTKMVTCCIIFIS